jgi:hypothetical protein
MRHLMTSEERASLISILDNIDNKTLEQKKASIDWLTNGLKTYFNADNNYTTQKYALYPLCVDPDDYLAIFIARNIDNLSNDGKYLFQLAILVALTSNHLMNVDDATEAERRWSQEILMGIQVEIVKRLTTPKIK